jgi:UDP-glucose 4-epimerase
MNVIIFGSKGFVGSQLCQNFLRYGYRVLEINRCEQLNVQVLKGIDFFINCAGSSNVSMSIECPKVDFEKNVVLVQVLLEAIRLSGNANLKFINLSSAAVYGNPQQLPVCESNQCTPISPYGYHKKMAEQLLLEYAQCYGLNSLTLRLFSAYGVGQRKMLLWDLHQKIVNSNGEITLFGTGEESRDFIHMVDIYQQLILAIENSKFEGEVVNVANGKEVYIKNIVEIYKSHYPKLFTYQFNGENRPGDPLNWCADIAIMKNWGYQNKIGIEQGIENYINWAVCQ